LIYEDGWTARERVGLEPRTSLRYPSTPAVAKPDNTANFSVAVTAALLNCIRLDDNILGFLLVLSLGGHSIAPEITSANAVSANP